jgi:CrcB protein
MIHILKVLLIGAGGFFGAAGRYLIGLLILNLVPTAFPLGTLVINFAGACLIGAITQAVFSNSSVNYYFMCFLTVGVLGGFTTFSTFSLDTVNLLEGGKLNLALLNIFASIVLCLLGVVLGKAIVRLIAG